VETDIIDFRVGAPVAIRQGFKCQYGTFARVTPGRATVLLPSGARRFFTRATRLEVGTKGHSRPYLTSVAAGHAAEYAHAQQQAMAARRLGYDSVLDLDDVFLPRG
jgi:hypothetical protein